MAKKFMFVCAGILMLAGAFALGARSAEAQIGDRAIVGITSSSFHPSDIGPGLPYISLGLIRSGILSNLLFSKKV